MASATDILQVTVLPEDGWAEMMVAMKAEGERLAQEKRDQGETFVVKALGPTTVRGGDKVPLSGANFPLDWKCATREEMAELAKELITKSYLLGFIDPALPTVLVLQRRFKEGRVGRHEGRLGAWHGSVWPARCILASPPATAAVQPARTVPGAASPAPPGRPAVS